MDETVCSVVCKNGEFTVVSDKFTRIYEPAQDSKYYKLTGIINKTNELVNVGYIELLEVRYKILRYCLLELQANNHFNILESVYNDLYSQKVTEEDVGKVKSKFQQYLETKKV